MKKYVFSTLHCKDIQKFCKNKIIKKKKNLHGVYYALGFISPLRVKHVKRERGRKKNFLFLFFMPSRFMLTHQELK